MPCGFASGATAICDHVISTLCPVTSGEVHACVDL